MFNISLFLMYRLICQKPAHFFLSKWLWWAPFFKCLYYLGRITLEETLKLPIRSNLDLWPKNGKCTTQFSLLNWIKSTVQWPVTFLISEKRWKFYKPYSVEKLVVEFFTHCSKMKMKCKKLSKCQFQFTGPLGTSLMSKQETKFFFIIGLRR